MTGRMQPERRTDQTDLSLDHPRLDNYIRTRIYIQNASKVDILTQEIKRDGLSLPMKPVYKQATKLMARTSPVLSHPGKFDTW